LSILEEGKCYVENILDILKLSIFMGSLEVLNIIILNLNSMMFNLW